MKTHRKCPLLQCDQMCSVYWEEWLGHPSMPLQLVGGLEIVLYILTALGGGLAAVCPALCEGACLSLGFPCCRRYYRSCRNTPGQVNSLSQANQRARAL